MPVSSLTLSVYFGSTFMHTEELISLRIMEEKHCPLFACHLAKCQEDADVIGVTITSPQSLIESKV